MSDKLAEIREVTDDYLKPRHTGKLFRIPADGIVVRLSAQMLGDISAEWLRWCVAEIDRLTAERDNQVVIQAELHAAIWKMDEADKQLEADNARLREALTKGLDIVRKAEDVIGHTPTLARLLRLFNDTLARAALEGAAPSGKKCRGCTGEALCVCGHKFNDHVVITGGGCLVAFGTSGACSCKEFQLAAPSGKGGGT